MLWECNFQQDTSALSTHRDPAPIRTLQELGPHVFVSKIQVKQEITISYKVSMSRLFSIFF